jgi:hypothetical protein
VYEEFEEYKGVIRILHIEEEQTTQLPKNISTKGQITINKLDT